MMNSLYYKFTGKKVHFKREEVMRVLVKSDVNGDISMDKDEFYLFYKTW
jgi:hypothetical protein